MSIDIVCKGRHLKHHRVNTNSQFYITKFDSFDNEFYFFYISPFIFYFSFQINEKQFCKDHSFNTNTNVNVNNIIRTNICEDILIVMFNQYCVRLYNLNWIKEYSDVLVTDEMNQFNRKFDNDYGLDSTGLPIDVVLDIQPPILFELQCFNHMLSIGGVPIHILYSDVKVKDKLLVYNIENKNLTGEFNLDNLIIDREQVEFHADQSGSIINFTQNELWYDEI